MSIAPVMQRLGVAPEHYETIPHPRASDPGAAARSVHVRARRLAAVTLVREPGGRVVMLVLPASEHLDLAVAQRVLGVADLVRLGAAEVRALFPDCDPDALPPFGARAGLPVVLDLCFFEEAEEEEDGGEIYFEAGNHREIGVMRFADFRRLAGPFAHEACLHERPRLARTVKHGGRGSLA